MNNLQDIMTKKPICLSEHANIHKARMLMAEKSIRHIPIKNTDTNQLIGMLSQKSVLANAINIINNRGLDALEHEEKSMPVSEIMDQSAPFFDVNDSLIDVANTLLKQKTGCVAVLEKDQLVGVITSNDFVKLAIQQLQE
jgi:CBS domain-containing membrane protein